MGTTDMIPVALTWIMLATKNRVLHYCFVNLVVNGTSRVKNPVETVFVVGDGHNLGLSVSESLCPPPDNIPVV